MRRVGVSFAHLTTVLVLLNAAQGLRGLQWSTSYHAAGEPQCKTHNRELSKFLSEVRPDDLLPQSAASFEEFVREVKTSLDAHMLPDRVIHHLFSTQSAFQPYCDGDWMEFGVAYGATINLAAGWRMEHCGICPYVHGFDTFTGLPEKWNRDKTTKYEAGAFDLQGEFPDVHANVNLVKGLFNVSLPAFLKRQAAYGAADSPLTFLHIDCDLYRGAADAFQLLAHKIVPGTVIVFDDLVNYQNYREGERLALWEYLQASGARLATIGMLGPLPGKDYAMELFMDDGAYDWFYQSAAFVVVSLPGKLNPFEQPHHGGEAHVGHHHRVLENDHIGEHGRHAQVAGRHAQEAGRPDQADARPGQEAAVALATGPPELPGRQAADEQPGDYAGSLLGQVAGQPLEELLTTHPEHEAGRPGQVVAGPALHGL